MNEYIPVSPYQANILENLHWADLLRSFVADNNFQRIRTNQ